MAIDSLSVPEPEMELVALTSNPSMHSYQVHCAVHNLVGSAVYDLDYHLLAMHCMLHSIRCVAMGFTERSFRPFQHQFQETHCPRL